MKRDRIEERISGIEREVKELRSELRQEIQSMVSELKEFQKIMLEDRIGEIQDALSREYRQIAYENCIASAESKFREQMAYDCPPDDDRDECIEHLVKVHLCSGIANLEDAPLDKANEVMTSIVDRDNKEQERLKGTVCEQCLNVYAVERDRLLEMAEKFTRYRKSLSTRRVELYFKQLPDDLAVSEIVDPLSHRARFAMLKGLTSRGMTFKELGDVTGYEGGHLIYHLNKLVSARLVAKDEVSSLYQITDKGMGVMEVVKQMYTC